LIAIISLSGESELTKKDLRNGFIVTFDDYVCPQIFVELISTRLLSSGKESVRIVGRVILLLLDKNINRVLVAPAFVKHFPVFIEMLNENSIFIVCADEIYRRFSCNMLDSIFRNGYSGGILVSADSDYIEDFLLDFISDYTSKICIFGDDYHSLKSAKINMLTGNSIVFSSDKDILNDYPLVLCFKNADAMAVTDLKAVILNFTPLSVTSGVRRRSLVFKRICFSVPPHFYQSRASRAGIDFSDFLESCLFESDALIFLSKIEVKGMYCGDIFYSADEIAASANKLWHH